MTGGLLLGGVLVLVVAAGVWRRSRVPLEQRPQPQRRSSAVRVEAYVFPLIGALIVGATLYDWAGTISLVFLAVGALFLLTGVSSFRQLRRRDGAAAPTAPTGLAAPARRGAEPGPARSRPRLS